VEVSFTPLDRPKLRWPLETEQFEHAGEKYLVLRDQHGIAKEPALIPAPCVPIVSRFDGVLSISDIAKEGASVGLTTGFVAQLAEELEKLSFLETEKTEKLWRELQDNYRVLSVRPPSHAGLVYAAEPEALKKELEEYIEQSNASIQPEISAPNEIFGIMSPHIDYVRGGLTYGSAYGALRAVRDPDVIVLIGTSHFGGESLYQMSRKDFASPLGVLPAATELIDDIAERYGKERAFRDEYFHKREHSLELQLPYLTYRFQSQTKPNIVPVIVGSFHKFLLAERSPLEDSEAMDFISGLAEAVRTLRKGGQKVLFYAGVDLAHVGRHFGDMEQVAPGGLADIELRDRLLIDSLIEADESALFSHLAQDLDRRRICGFPSLYTILASARLAGLHLRGELLEYRQAAEPKSDCVVTFASMYWRAL